MLGQKADVFLVFFEMSPYCFLQWLHWSESPPRVHAGSLFSTTSPTLVCWFVYDGHSDWCEVVFHCGFNLYLWWLVMLSILSYVPGPSVWPLWRSICSGLCPFLSWVLCIPGVESCEFFVYFGDQTLVWGIIGKYVFPYGWFSFHFNVVFFSHAEAFYFDEFPFVYSFLYAPCFRGRVCENVAVTNSIPLTLKRH